VLAELLLLLQLLLLMGAVPVLVTSFRPGAN
jgi:hypothetical protein